MSKNPQGNSPNQKMDGMGKFNEGHFEKKFDQLGTSDLKYTSGEMSNPEHLAKSVEGLVGFVKKKRMTYP